MSISIWMERKHSDGLPVLRVEGNADALRELAFICDDAAKTGSHVAKLSDGGALSGYVKVLRIED